MLKKIFWLMLHALWSISILSGCKSKVLDPNDKLMGIYSEALYPKGYIHNNYFLSMLNIEKKEEKRVSIDVSNITIGETLEPAGGYVTRKKDFKFPNCELIQIDTTNSIEKDPPFAKIINRDTNVEIGKVRNYTALAYGPEIKIGSRFYRFQADFIVQDTLHVTTNFYKWQD